MVTIFDRLARALHEDEPIALITRLDGEAIGAKAIATRDEQLGDLGTAGLTYAAVAEARALLALGETTVRTFGDDGEPTGTSVRVFIQTFAPKADMYIFGAIDFSRAMARMGKYLGYRVTAVDARPIFATKARIPDADDVIVAWPHEFLQTARVDERTVIIVLTHDEKFDIPVLQVALGTPAAYIGAMGSRSTHERRVTALRARGLVDEAIARICAPVGLDLGARTPEETAVSIAAEIVALRYRRPGGRLTGGRDPIHVNPVAV